MVLLYWEIIIFKCRSHITDSPYIPFKELKNSRYLEISVYFIILMCYYRKVLILKVILQKVAYS